MAVDAKISELPVATTPLAGTEESEILQGGINKRVAVSHYGATTDLLIDLISASVSAGTLTLDSNSQKQRRFYVSATQSANFTIAFSNDSACLIKTLDIQVTGTINITLPSSVVMQEDDVRWNNGTKILNVVGGTASPIEFSFTKSGSVWKLKVSTKYYAS